MEFILRILGNVLALYFAHILVPGFTVSGVWKEFLIAGVFLGLLNAIIKPPIKLITFPLIILTLGLFILVINGLLLWVVDYIFDFVSIANLVALFWAVIVISIVNLLASISAKVID